VVTRVRIVNRDVVFEHAHDVSGAIASVPQPTRAEYQDSPKLRVVLIWIKHSTAKLCWRMTFSAEQASHLQQNIHWMFAAS
jgi:hypothetical protein